MTTYPTIHLNGTSAGELLDQYRNAYFAIVAAIDAVYKTAPNGRDYYPQIPDGYARASVEHEARLDDLQTVKYEIEKIVVAIQDQTHDRKKS